MHVILSKIHKLKKCTLRFYKGNFFYLYMKRISIFFCISLILLISGFVMEFLSILMFNGQIWSDIGQIRGHIGTVWPIHEPNYCFCVPIYRSAYYFHFFVFGIILIFSAMTLLVQQLYSSSHSISYINIQRVNSHE